MKPVAAFFKRAIDERRKAVSRRTLLFTYGYLIYIVIRHAVE